MDQLGMVRFVTNLAVETVIERTSVHKLLERVKDLLPGGDEWDQEAGLLDSDYQLAMLRFREEHMLAGVARRLKRGIDHKMNPGVVFSQVQDHVIAAANAHVERLVLEAFVEKVRAMPDRRRRNKVALGLLCDLFALSTIEADRAWFMEHGRLHRALQGDQPRDQRAVPQDPPARRRPRRRVRRPRRDAAGARADRSPRLTRRRLLGGWDADPLWGTFYDWSVEHPHAGGAVWMVGIQSDLRVLYRAAERDRPRSRRDRGSSTSRAAAGWRSGRCCRARSSSTSPPTSRSG